MAATRARSPRRTNPRAERALDVFAIVSFVLVPRLWSLQEPAFILTMLLVASASIGGVLIVFRLFARQRRRAGSR